MEEFNKENLLKWFSENLTSWGYINNKDESVEILSPNSIGMDSIDMVETMMQLEFDFHITIEDEVAEQCFNKTFDEICNIIINNVELNN